jgi:hypothetical protein
LDKPLRSIYEKSDEWNAEERVIHATSISLYGSGFSSADIQFLTVFRDILNQSDKHFGYIHVYAGNEGGSDEVSLWIRRLKDYFDKDLRVGKSRLKTIGEGSGIKSTALLIIKAKSIR